MKRRLLLPLLGILALLLCGCDRTDSLSFYIDKMPENTRAYVVLYDTAGQPHDMDSLKDSIRIDGKNMKYASGLGLFEDTYGCDERLFLAPRDEKERNPVYALCKAYPSCALELRDSTDGEALQTSGTISLILPDKFAYAKRIIYNTAENTVRYDKLLPRTVLGLTVSGWTSVIFCTAMLCIPILLILLLCCDLRRHMRRIRTTAALLTVPGVLFCVLYLLQICLPYLNLNDIPLKPADFLCLLAVLPNCIMLLLLRRRQRRESINTNGVSL